MVEYFEKKNITNPTNLNEVPSITYGNGSLLLVQTYHKLHSQEKSNT
jgi:hypothetical protein